MNVALRQIMTREQFLEWEERQPTKYEFDGQRPVAMNGVTRAHAKIEINLAYVLNGRLAGKPREVFGSNLKIAVGRSIRYPDAFIVCTPGPGQARVIDDPVIVFEILSQSTATTDRTIKNLEYQATPSIQRYVMLEQTAVSATVFTRDGAAWRSMVYGPGSILAMPEAGIEVSIDELYRGVSFDSVGPA
jgi:Uma2 family endonuclease